MANYNKQMPTNPIKKGETRNPNGRPKKGTTLSDILRKKMGEFVTVEEMKDGKVVIVKKRNKELLAEVVAKNAIEKGDIKFIEFWTDRTEGKVTQPIEGKVGLTVATVKFIDSSDDSPSND